MMDNSKVHGRWNRMTENYGDDPNVFGNPGSRWPDGSRTNLTAGFLLVNPNHLNHQQVSPDSGCSGVRQVQNAIDITVFTDVGELDYTDYYWWLLYMYIYIYITRLSYEYIFFRASQEFPIFLDSKEEDAVEQRVEIDSGADMTVETYPVYLGAPKFDGLSLVWGWWAKLTFAKKATCQKHLRLLGYGRLGKLRWYGV